MTQVSLGRWLTPAKSTDVVVFAGDAQQDPEDVCKDMVRYIVEEAMSRTFEEKKIKYSKWDKTHVAISLRHVEHTQALL